MQSIVGLSYDMALRMARTGRAYITRPSWRNRAVFICSSCQLKSAETDMSSAANVFGLPADLPRSIVFRSSLMQIEVEPSGSINVVPFVPPMSEMTASDWIAMTPDTWFVHTGVLQAVPSTAPELDPNDMADIDVNNG